LITKRNYFYGLLCAIVFVSSCASGSDQDGEGRTVQNLRVIFDQHLIVKSSVIEFEMEGTASKEANYAKIRFVGSAGNDVFVDFENRVIVDRRGTKGNLVCRVRVVDGLWEVMLPTQRRTFTGRIEITLVDDLGVFASGEISSERIVFEPNPKPEVESFNLSSGVYPNEKVKVKGKNILRESEGKTWAIVDSGQVVYEDNSSLPIANSRYPLAWKGEGEGYFVIHPNLFGVRTGRFTGEIRFENELNSGEIFLGNSQSLSTDLRPPEALGISPQSGSRGQKILLEGRGFLVPDPKLDIGTYLIFEGTLTPDDARIAPIVVEGPSAFIRSPFRVIDESELEQEVWYDVEADKQSLSGLGALPGRFNGTVQPVIFHGGNEQFGKKASFRFTILPSKQVVYVKYLPGFSKALDLYGLKVVEVEVKERIRTVLTRDYEDVNVEFREEPPLDFIDFTTIEIGGTDPSGLLNFGYDNSFNDGGKDVNNLYLSDYLGGVNRHSEDAGYLPYGGVFIESFSAFSPRLFPDNFGTSAEFDRMMSPFMLGLNGRKISADEWPQGPRDAAIRNAIDMIGSLTGHTASHEIGHALGLAHFPSGIPGAEERFHNDPPGDSWIMDAGADRPFDERAEINGRGPAAFNQDNLEYLQRVLPKR